MLYIFSGQDDYSIRQALAQLKEENGDAFGLDDSTTVMDGQKLTTAELVAVSHALPFLSGKRLVIVNGLLSRFNPQRRARRNGNARRKEEKNDQHLEFVECLSNVPDSTVLVLIDTEIINGNPLFKELSSKATVKTFAPMKEPQLREWIEKRVAAQNGHISSRTANLLARMVGSDLWVMANEVDKLVLFTLGRDIEEKDIQALVSYSQQGNVFNLVDAIMAQNAQQAERLLQHLLDGGAAPTYLLAMITRQFRLILRARELREQRLKNTEIQSRLGLSSDWLVRKVLEQSTRFTTPRLKDIYHHLLDTDVATKTGGMEPELALTVLVAELCQKPHAKIHMRR